MPSPCPRNPLRPISAMSWPEMRLMRRSPNPPPRALAHPSHPSRRQQPTRPRVALERFLEAGSMRRTGDDGQEHPHALADYQRTAQRCGNHSPSSLLALRGSRSSEGEEQEDGRVRTLPLYRTWDASPEVVPPSQFIGVSEPNWTGKQRLTPLCSKGSGGGTENAGYGG